MPKFSISVIPSDVKAKGAEDRKYNTTRGMDQNGVCWVHSQYGKTGRTRRAVIAAKHNPWYKCMSPVNAAEKALIILELQVSASIARLKSV